MRSPVNPAVTLSAFLMMGWSVAASAATSEEVLTGPAADYPVTVGAPFTVGTTVWTPADQLNYDAVGAAQIQDTLPGVSAAHKTLPLPSYAEVTSLASGRTILVRIVERGPMANETLLALSKGAAAQLGVDAGAPVRVRRVNPPEIERAALRTGGRVPQRMDTPESLLKVLRRKFADQSPLSPPPSTPPRMPQELPSGAAIKPAPIATPAPSAAPVPTSTTTKPPVSLAISKTDVPQSPAAVPKIRARGSTVVQVATFSSAERARAAAAKLRGQISPSGRLWRVRLGPFASRGEAAAALGKARTAGYSDARIQRAD